jgi:hypothetical protein
MSINGALVSEYIVGDDPRSSDAGPSTNPLDKLTNCPLQQMGVAVGASATAADAEIEQLPEDEGPVVVPLEGAGEGVQVTGVLGDVVHGYVGRRRWQLKWRHQLLNKTQGWRSRMDQGDGVFSRAP